MTHLRTTLPLKTRTTAHFAHRSDALTRLLGVLCILVVGLLGACDDSTTLSEGEHKRLRNIVQRGLAHSDEFVQAEAIRTLQLARPTSLNDLRQARLKSSSPMLRAGAAVSLATHDPPKAQGAFVGLLSKGDPKKRIFLLRDALEVLPPGEERKKLIATALRSSDREFCITALLHGVGRDLSNEKVDLNPFLKGVVGHKDTVVAGIALSILHSRGHSQSLIDEFVRDAKTGTPVARRRALRVLAESGIKEVRSALPPLQAPEPVPAPDRVPPEHPDEVSPPEDDPPPKPEAPSLDLLIAHAAVGNCEDLDGLRNALGKADKNETGRVIRALKGCPTQEAYRLLRTHREDKHAPLRLWAYRSMSVHPKANGKDFKRGLRDSDDHVTSAALQGLIRSAPRLFGGLLDSALKESNDVARLLTLVAATRRRMEQEGDVASVGTFDEEIVQIKEPLKTFLKDEDLHVRAASAEVFFLLPDRDALFKEVSPAPLEVRYAWLDAHARHPDTRNPLQHLETFQTVSEGAHLPLALIAAAAIWNAFEQQNQTTSTPAKAEETAPSPEP